MVANYELEKMRKEAIVAYLKAVPEHARRDGGKARELSFKIIVVLTEIRN
jgi:hypothetical protein